MPKRHSSHPKSKYSLSIFSEPVAAPASIYPRHAHEADDVWLGEEEKTEDLAWATEEWRYSIQRK